jgi:hypothetical protein
MYACSSASRVTLLCRYFGNPYLNGSFVSKVEAVNASCSSSPLLHSAQPSDPSPPPVTRRNTARGFGWSARWSGFYRPVSTGVTTLYLQHTAGRSVIVVNNLRVGGAEAVQGGTAMAFGVVNVTSRFELPSSSTLNYKP